MLYKEYLPAAYRHLASSKHMVQALMADPSADDHTSQSVLCDAYYLAGYVLEALTVYSLYSHYRYPDNQDIMKQFDSKFTQRSGVDFFDDGKRVYKNNPISLGNKYSLVHHTFQPIIQGPLSVISDLRDVPLIGNGATDPQHTQLMDQWSPAQRYQASVTISPQQLNTFLDTCQRAANMISTIYPY